MAKNRFIFLRSGEQAVIRRVSMFLSETVRTGELTRH